MVVRAHYLRVLYDEHASDWPGMKVQRYAD
jgi:hypothetical protein